jgi:hypothetical protein
LCSTALQEDGAQLTELRNPGRDWIMGKAITYAFFYVSYFAGVVALVGAAGVLLPDRKRRRRIATALLTGGVARCTAALVCALSVGAFVNL